MRLDFYKIPSGAFNLASGVPAVVLPAGNAVLLSSLSPIAVNKTGFPGSSFTTQWQAQNFSIDTSSVSGGERVLVVATAVDVNSYFAFDNIVITAAPTAVPEVTLSCTPNVLTDSPVQQASCTVTANQPVLSDLVVGLVPPVSSTRYTSNCGPTVTILAGQTTASCTLIAGDNTVPGDGSVTASLALLPDTAATARYTLSTPSTASVQVQDDDPPPVVSLGCTPATLTDSPNQRATCTVTASHAAAADLDVLISPPASHARYTSTCASPLRVLAGQTTASCTVTASDNTTVGDGDVSVTLSLLADPSAAPRYALGTPVSANLLVQDDDQAAPVAVVQPVPSLSPWALAGLLGLTAAAAAWVRRRS